MACRTVAEAPPQEQAEAITLSIHAGVTGGVATKADLEKVETGLRGDIDLLRSDMNGKIERAKFDLTWRLLGGFAVLNAIMVAILRFMGGV
ncbi:hypothetical protein [Hoeflea sp.]|uniref:hypothetical protein n=1 Tax=Hoeflea sp. TaxID=1940281 RepID=UPI003B0175CD